MNEGRDGGAGPGGLSRLLLAIVFPSLAVALGVSSYGRVSTPPTATARAQERASDSVVREPRSDCQKRFLEPFALLTGEDLAGETEEPSSRAVRTDGGAADADAASAANTSAADAGAADAGGADAASGGGGEDAGTSRWNSRIDKAIVSLRRVMGKNLDVDVMIATLPDPRDTGLGYQFDAQLQALRLGMEVSVPSRQHAGRSTRYNRDRDWLPWDDRGLPLEKRATSLECRRELPGVVLFRGADHDAPSMMVLLVVGESPVVGVHATAAREALSIADRFAKHAGLGASSPAARDLDVKDDILVLGPTFSGSASSLRRALDEFRRAGGTRRVQVISGTASGPEVPKIIRRGGLTLIDPTTYLATTTPQQSAVCAFLYHAVGAGAHRSDGPAPRAVDGVAMLQESGTEFGTTLAPQYGQANRPSSPCPLQPEIELSFPFHVAAIRDAYEALDNSSTLRAERDATMARHTALDVSLRSSHRLDVEEPSSAITKYAQDLALRNVLSEISREGVRWVGIQATDITDAIFLARKIRDVAPDVRLAFFTADALLLHPTFRADLLGSLVIGPYPFLGSDDFWPRTRLDDARRTIVPHAHASFPNAEAEGTFNAALALRGLRPEKLTEYAFIQPSESTTQQLQPLPIWTAAIGRTGIVPIRAGSAIDCDLTIYGNANPSPRSLCNGTSDQDPGAYGRYNTLRNLELHVDPDVTPPRLWNFVFALLVLASVLHSLFEKRVLEELGEEEFPPLAAPPDDPSGLTLVADDSRLDRGIVHTKWLLYAAFAQTTLLLAVSYFAAVYAIALTTYAFNDSAVRLGCALCLALISLAVTAWKAGRSLLRVHQQRRSFCALIMRGPSAIMTRLGLPGKVLLAPGQPSHWSKWGVAATLWLGFADTRQPRRSIYVSYAQLRSMFLLGVVTCGAFGTLLTMSLIHTTDIGRPGGGSVPALTLFVLRSLPLTNGVSPAVPLLLSLMCTYLWAVGRMERLRLIHGLSRMSPPDGVADCVSTPIRAILYPRHGAGVSADQGFTDCERRLTNTILRPNGRSYFLAITVIWSLPIVLFYLKKPTTLEPGRDTWLLVGAMAVCAILISSTLVQFLQYWHALDRVLKRIMVHPLGVAFQRIQSPIRQDLDAQVSQMPDDLLRLAACADTHELLMLGRGQSIASALRRESIPLPVESPNVSSESLAASRRKALGQSETMPRDGTSSLPPSAQRSRPQDDLGQKLIETARTLVHTTLLRFWYTDVPGVARLPMPSVESKQVLSDDRVAATAVDLNVHEQDWLRHAETYAASVVALLVNRHVRQFRHFLYTTTGCSLLLLLAIASYPFEPHRTLMLCMWILMIAVVGSNLWVFVQLDRDPLLSHLAGDVASSGKVSWNRALASRVLLWVIVPVLGLMAVQYPSVAHELARLVEPFTRALL